jgi:hypothetical protein
MSQHFKMIPSQLRARFSEPAEPQKSPVTFEAFDSYTGRKEKKS